MAKTEKRARERLRSSSYFLGCFGYSPKIYSDKPMVVKEDGVEKKKKKKKKNKKRLRHWFLCSRICLKNGEIKPSPTEETETPVSRVVYETDKQKTVSVIRRTTDCRNIPVDDKPLNQETKKTKPTDLRDIAPGRAKPMEPLSSLIKDTCPVRNTTSKHYVRPDLKPTRAINGSRVDPVIGISIIILTLMVTLVWGRVCAILCTSALCYVLPRVRNATAFVKTQTQRKRRF